MDRRRRRVAALLAAVEPWARREPGVDGVALAGSWAAARARPDSDVDLVVVTPDRARWATDHRRWAAGLVGDAELTWQQDWGPWLTEVRLRLGDGLEVEVGLVDPEWTRTDPVDPGTARVVADGWVVLHDPHGVLARLARAVDARPPADVEISADLVRALLRDQHPDLAARPLRHAGGGWDNEMWRLGPDLAVRLPRRAGAAPLAGHEQRWLPELATLVRVPVPVPFRTGTPSGDYPYPWTVVPWLGGTCVSGVPTPDRRRWAARLADALVDLHVAAPADAPPNPVRGVALAERAEAVAQRLTPPGIPGADQLERIWADALAAPAWTGPPLWLHGDVHPGNLLADDGDLAGLLDFGDLTAGDPATDLATAWLTFDRAGRATFRARLVERGAWDDARWRRARGWAVVMTTAMLRRPHDPTTGAVGRHALAQLLDEPVSP